MKSAQRDPANTRRRPRLPAEDPPAATPPWVLSYGDLMSLLVACFVLLVSMSQWDPTPHAKAVVDSIQNKFRTPTFLESVLRGFGHLAAEAPSPSAEGRVWRREAIDAAPIEPKSATTAPAGAALPENVRRRLAAAWDLPGHVASLTSPQRDALARLAAELRAEERVELVARGGFGTNQTGEQAWIAWDGASAYCRQVVRELIDRGVGHDRIAVRWESRGADAAGDAARDAHPTIRVELIIAHRPEDSVSRSPISEASVRQRDRR